MRIILAAASLTALAACGDKAGGNEGGMSGPDGNEQSVAVRWRDPGFVPPPDAPSPPSAGHARPRANLASYISADDYPAAALRDGAQGRVAFVLEIGANGRVAGCTITGSSGSGALDSASCRIMRSRARYMPARDASGAPVPDFVRGELNWILPRD